MQHRFRHRMVACSVASLIAGATAFPDSGALYFPPKDGPWETVDAGAAGWNGEKLDEALDYAGEMNSSGVVVVFEGRILAERYWPLENASDRYANLRVGETDDGRAIEDVTSVQKSVVSFLVAIARERGHFKLTDRVSNYLDIGWSNAHRDREHEITLRQLMTMTSGLKPSLAYQVAPGTLWRYNTRAYSKMVPVLETAAGRDIQTLTREWITGPTGMRESRWTERPWLSNSIDANRIGFATTARDLARFGLLVLAEGTWDGKALLKDRALLRESLEPSQKLNPAYGLLWWLNGQSGSVTASRGDRTGPLIPTAPDDLVGAFGALDRKCYVVPSLRLVVTRLGDRAGRSFDREFWRRLSAAAPGAGE